MVVDSVGRPATYEQAFHARVLAELLVAAPAWNYPLLQTAWKVAPALAATEPSAGQRMVRDFPERAGPHCPSMKIPVNASSHRSVALYANCV